MAENKPFRYVMVFCVCIIKKLTISVAFIAVMESVLWAILIRLEFRCYSKVNYTVIVNSNLQGIAYN